MYERSQISQSKNFRGQIRHEQSIQFPQGIRKVLKIFNLRDIVVCFSLLKFTTSQARFFLLSRFNEQNVEARTIVERLHLHERNTIIVLKNFIADDISNLICWVKSGSLIKSFLHRFICGCRACSFLLTKFQIARSCNSTHFAVLILRRFVCLLATFASQ